MENLLATRTRGDRTRDHLLHEGYTARGSQEPCNHLERSSVWSDVRAALVETTRSSRGHLEADQRPSRDGGRRRATSFKLRWRGAERTVLWDPTRPMERTSTLKSRRVHAWRRGTHDPHTSWSCEFMYASWQLRQRFASGRCTPSGDPGGLRLGAVIGEPNRGCVDRTAELVEVPQCRSYSGRLRCRSVDACRPERHVLDPRGGGLLFFMFIRAPPNRHMPTA